MSTKPANNILLTSIVLVLAAIATSFYYMGRAITAFAVGLVIAWLAWLAGSYDNKKPSKRLLLLYGVGILIQCGHFAEEYFTGFQQQFPLLIAGYEWSDKQFLFFNLCWVIIFIASGIGITRGNRFAYIFVLFFLLIGQIGNGIFHPLLSLYAGSYFPGLYTSFLHLAIGILLFKELRKLSTLT